MTEHSSPVQDDNIWWPWIAGFAIGILVVWFFPFLAFALWITFPSLNLLRMGRKDKAILLSGLSILYIVLWRFINYPESTFNIFIDWGIYFIVGQMVITLIVFGVFFAVAEMDVRQFIARGETPQVIPTWTGVVFIVALVSAYFLTSVGLNYLSQKYGACKFPTVYDLVAQYQEAQADGLAGLLVQRKDMGCGKDWYPAEIVYMEFPFEGESSFVQGINRQGVYLIEQIITDSDVDLKTSGLAKAFYDGTKLTIQLMDIPEADYYRYDCIDATLFKECNAILVMDDIVYGLDVRVMVGDDQSVIEDLMNQILRKAVQNILTRKTSLP